MKDRNGPGRDITLKGLEVFQALANTGSVQEVAAESGLSVSTVSHHLTTLENGLGIRLVDRGKRPMVLTPAGTVFLRHVEEGLRAIRRGKVELTMGNIAVTRELRLGVIDDFEEEIAPEIVQFLAQVMPSCAFQHLSRPSHELLSLLAQNKLEIAVAAQPQERAVGLIEYPLLRDPFVAAIPADIDVSVSDLLDGKGKIPFLRYAQSQMIGHQIETQLQRQRLHLENRYELDSNHMLLAMVADRAGWTITTVASFMRVKRLHGQIVVRPLPIEGFSRSLSLFTSDINATAVAHTVYTAFCRLIRQRFLEPAVAEMPWLGNSFVLLEGGRAVDKPPR